MTVIVITGPKNSGKSTLLYNIMDEYRVKVATGGIITLGHEKRFFYNVKEDVMFPFYGEDEEYLQVGRFRISVDALNFAKQGIIRAKDNKLIFIDEIGLLEKERKGLYLAVKPVLDEDSKDKLIFMVVREGVVEELERIFDISNITVIELSEYPSKALIEEIHQRINLTLNIAES